MAKKDANVDVSSNESERTRLTKKAIFVKDVTDESMTAMLLDLCGMGKEEFATKWGFDKTTAVATVLEEDLKEKYPESKLRTLVAKSKAGNIYVTGTRIENAKEIRIKVKTEVYEEYKELMEGYKDTMRGEVVSEVMHRGMEDLLARKRRGEKLLRIPAIPEQEI